MALNIKDEKVHELVRELAEETGVSQTAAVRDAVEARLRRVRRGKAIAEFIETMKKDGPFLPEGIDSTNATDELYDEYGLPK